MTSAFAVFMRAFRGISLRAGDRPEKAPMARKFTLHRVIVVVGFVAVTYAGLGSLVLPHGPDQAIFAWAGDVILDGGVPYRNAWDIKGPLAYYIYAFAEGVFGRREISIRLLDFAIVLCGCGLLRKVVLRLNGRNSFGANCAVICYGLLYYTGGYADTAQPEGWGALLMLAVVALLVLPDEWEPKATATAGALMACAALIKPTYLIYGILPFVYIAATQPSARHQLWIALRFFFLGFSVPLGLAVLMLLSAAALTDFIDVLRYLYTTYETVDRPSGLVALSALPVSLLNTGILSPLLLVPIGLREIWNRKSRPVAILVATWLALAILTVIIQAQYWQDHWLPAALAASAIFGAALSGIGPQHVSRRTGVLGTVIALILVILITFAPPGWRSLSRNALWPAYVLGFQSEPDYIREVTAPFNEVEEPYNYTVMRRLSNFISAHSQSSDLLVVWGWDVAVFNMSARRSATRFGVFQPLIEDGPIKAKYQRMFLSELASNNPKYVLVDSRGAWFMSEGSGLKLLREFPEFEHALHTRYRLLTVLDVYQVWIRLLPSQASEDQTKN
jgi:hypothetical protein